MFSSFLRMARGKILEKWTPGRQQIYSPSPVRCIQYNLLWSASIGFTETQPLPVTVNKLQLKYFKRLQRPHNLILTWYSDFIKGRILSKPRWKSWLSTTVQYLTPQYLQNNHQGGGSGTSLCQCISILTRRPQTVQVGRHVLPSLTSVLSWVHWFSQCTLRTVSEFPTLPPSSGLLMTML